MHRLFRAFFFRIKRDLTFRITLCVGAGVAVFMAVLYYILQVTQKEQLHGMELLTGPNMLVNSFSPVQSFGFAIPINLISFTCLEFSQGTIRNKIIAGNSKFKIYASLFLTGLVFTFALLGVYVGVCTALGSIFGGFDLSKWVSLPSGEIGPLNVPYILKLLVVVFFSYITIVSLSIFVATLFRNMGPCIPIVTMSMLICYITVMILKESGVSSDDLSGVISVFKVVNPLYAMSSGTEVKYLAEEVVIEGVAETIYTPLSVDLPLDTMLFGIGNNLVYTSIFFVVGIYLFMKKDVK